MQGDGRFCGRNRVEGARVDGAYSQQREYEQAAQATHRRGRRSDHYRQSDWHYCTTRPMRHTASKPPQGWLSAPELATALAANLDAGTGKTKRRQMPARGKTARRRTLAPPR